MPIKACQRYEFVTTGVGCVIHGEPDCLCDVVVKQPLPVVALPEGYESLTDLVEDAEQVFTRVEIRAAEQRIRTVIGNPQRYHLYRLLWSEGLTTYEIAERLETSPYTVYVSALGNWKHEWTSPMLHVEQLAITGATLDDMYEAAHPPLNKRSINAHVLKHMGIVPPASRLDQALIRAMALVDEGTGRWLACKDAAVEFDVNVDCVYDRLTARRKRKVL